MGGLPWDVAARDLPVPEAISKRRAALGIPQATPRAQEAPPQAAKRGQGQACGDGQTAPDTQDQSTKTSKSVYNIISTQGCQHPIERSETAVAGVEARLVIGLGAVGQVATDQLGLVNLNHEIGRELEPRRRALGGKVGRGTAAKLGHADVLGPALDVVDAGDAVGVAGYE